MKIHGSQIPPDIRASKLIDQLSKVIQKAREKSDKVLCILSVSSAHSSSRFHGQFPANFSLCLTYVFVGKYFH